MKRNHNHNKSKIHRSYTVEEVAELYGVHKRTVRNWIKKGLPIFDDIRPLLILGTDLKIFIRKQRKGNKFKCKLSEIYCFRCRIPRKPDLQKIKFSQQPSGIGRVFAMCSVCDSKVNKYFSWRRLDAIQRELLMESTVSTKTHKYEG
jgi:predicted DNA-binding protein YlxM (UPF0122 family)